MNNIAVVDDNAVSLANLTRLLQRAGLGEVRPFRDPVAALTALTRDPVDILLVDYTMPELDGPALLDRLRDAGRGGHTAMAVVTNSAGVAEVRARSLRAGAVDIIPKMLAQDELVPRVTNLLRLVGRPVGVTGAQGFQPLVARRVTTTADRPEVSTDGEWITLLEQLAAMGDEDSGAHTRRVGRYAAAIARAHGLPEDHCRLLAAAAPLHDIGKLATPVDLRSGSRVLTPVEREQMRQHAAIGHTLLSGVDAPLMQLAAEIALSHHERWDGAGYPNRLAGAQIPLSARIVALADTFDLLTAIRPFRPEWLFGRARAVIEADAGGHFDPDVVASFVSVIAELSAIKKGIDGEEAALLPTSSFDLLRHWH